MQFIQYNSLILFTIISKCKRSHLKNSYQIVTIYDKSLVIEKRGEFQLLKFNDIINVSLKSDNEYIYIYTKKRKTPGILSVHYLKKHIANIGYIYLRLFEM